MVRKTRTPCSTAATHAARNSPVYKDNAPHRNPARIEDVTEEMIAAFFADAWVGATHPLADLGTEGNAQHMAATQVSQG